MTKHLLTLLGAWGLSLIAASLITSCTHMCAQSFAQLITMILGYIEASTRKRATTKDFDTKRDALGFCAPERRTGEL
jgi:hypothetical protein